MNILHALEGRERDLGDGFTVRRLLPASACRSVGPFIFFDHLGPLDVAAGVRHDVRPHPHIGLATVTYLFEGAITHRDSLGHVQRIEPGAINWMTAGRGIVHSERTPDDMQGQARRMHGLQLWCALPATDEECDPAFAHYPASGMPEVREGDVGVRVLVGELHGSRSPVETMLETLYLDVTLAPGAAWHVPAVVAERALYCIQGEVALDGLPLPAHRLVVLKEGASPVLASVDGARVVVVGGEALPEPRYMWWNLVSSRRERIQQAAADWESRRFAPIPGDDEERIPLPESRFA
ncbi:MAG: pirin family protein [Rhodocyclaceae bacterium]|nr:pirin family protein [Rhodocyclaceae bacterium]